MRAAEICNRPEPDYRIKRVWPARGLVQSFADSSCGKTFIGIDQLGAVARGLPDWNGKRLLQGRTLWICAEGRAKPRLLAYQKHHAVNLNDFEFYTLELSPDLRNPEHVRAIGNELKTLGGIDVCLIDTLAASMQGNESSGEDMGVVLANLRVLQKVCPLIVWNTHPGHADKSRARGWSGMRAAVDAETEITRSGKEFGCLRSYRITKMRDGGGEGDTYTFRLVEHEVGLDNDGEPLTSCAVQFTDEAPVPTGTTVATPRGARQQKLFRALQTMAPDGSLVPVADLIDTVIEEEPAERRTFKWRGKFKDTLCDMPAFVHVAGDMASLAIPCRVSDSEWLN